MTVYEVVGRFEYRGHRPGTRFEATLDPVAEVRAVQRGALVVVNRTQVKLRPGSYTLPKGWARA